VTSTYSHCSRHVGQVSGGASLLTVLPHFWQARWFIGLASLGLLASVAGTVRIVEKRKHQRRLKLLEQERALEHERARIAHHRRRLVHGSPARVRERLLELAAQNEADELIVITITGDYATRLESYALLADAFGLGAAAA